MVFLNAIFLSMTLFCQLGDTVPVSVPAPTVWEVLQLKYDANLDNRISAKEHGRGETAFLNLDTNSDGYISQADFEVEADGKLKKRKSNGRDKRKAPPKVGDVAPDFELQVLVHEEKSGKTAEKKPPVKAQGKDLLDEEKVKTVRLSSFTGKKPVALIFGSYT